MGAVIRFLLAFYVGVGLLVAGGGLYGYLTAAPPRSYSCPEIEAALAAGAAPAGTMGEPEWEIYVARRGAMWPVAWWRDRAVAPRPLDWLLLKYDAFPDACQMVRQTRFSKVDASGARISRP